MQFRCNCKACSNLHNEQLRRKCAKSTQSAQIIFAQFLSYRVTGTPLVIINRAPTAWDNVATLVMHDSIGKVLSEAIG